MLKADVCCIEKRGVKYCLDAHGKPRVYQPWLGDRLAFLYDYFMQKSVFPKKFAADIDLHARILKQELGGIRNARILELATGSGSIATILDPVNQYNGTDISAGLQRIAARRFREAGFQDAQFYAVSADDLPFADAQFDICICNLSLNFFPDQLKTLREIRRVLHSGGRFFASIPVPERKTTSSPIRGTLYSSAEYRDLCVQAGFDFQEHDHQNGALLYFSANLSG